MTNSKNFLQAFQVKNFLRPAVTRSGAFSYPDLMVYMDSLIKLKYREKSYSKLSLKRGPIKKAGSFEKRGLMKVLQAAFTKVVSNYESIVILVLPLLLSTKVRHHNFTRMHKVN